jgi:predicted DNA-binding mobile mystery protein A
MKNTPLQRKQLEVVFSQLRQLNIQPPLSGWLHAIRHAFEMPLKTVAKKLGQTIQGAKDLEVREANGNVTLKTLREAAEAMNCHLIYFIVPNEPLDVILDSAAQMLADKMTRSVSRSMTLEGQQTTTAEQNEARRILADKLKGDPKRIWRGLNETWVS